MITNNLRGIRTKAGLSMEQLGKLVGVSRQTIHNTETNACGISLHVAFKIAGILGKSIQDIWVDGTEYVETTITVRAIK